MRKPVHKQQVELVSLSIARKILYQESSAPTIIVPVLSKTMCVILAKFSRASPFLTSMPCSAPLPVATIIAVGVARPRASRTGNDKHRHKNFCWEARPKPAKYKMQRKLFARNITVRYRSKNKFYLLALQ